MTSHVDQYAAHLALMRQRPRTVYQRTRSLIRLESFSGPLLSLSIDDLRAFVTQPQLGAEAQNGETDAIKGFFRWAYEEGFIQTDPSRRLHRPKRDKTVPKPIPEHLLSLAIAEAEEPIRTWLMISAYSGLRCCELSQLSGRDFLIHQRTLIVQESKGGGISSVPIAAAIMPLAAELAQRETWCWPTTNPRSILPHVAAGRVSKLINDHFRALDIPFRAHSCRHRYGTQAYRATGRDIRATQELLRHKSIVSTTGYTEVDKEEAARALDALPRLTA